MMKFIHRLAGPLAAVALAACAELQTLQKEASNLVGPGTKSATAEPASPEPAESDLSPAQSKMRQQAAALDTPVWQTATFWQGTAAGAAAGGLIAALTGGDAKDIAVGAAAGAAVGALAGAYVANKQQAYASREAVLDSMIADVRLKNAQAEDLIAGIQQVIAEDRKQLAQLERDYRQRKIDRQQMDRQLAVVRADRRRIAAAAGKAQEQLVVFTEARTEYRKQNPQVATPVLDKELAGFEKRIGVLNAMVKDLSIPELG